MSKVKHTKSSLGRTSFIQRSLSQSSSSNCNTHSSPLQKYNRKSNELRQKIFQAQENLTNLNSKIESIHYNIPIKLKNLEKSNNKEIQIQKDFLKDVNRTFELALTDFQRLSLEEQRLRTRIEELENQINDAAEETDKRNYHIFKKGQFQGYLEAEECQEIREPCHLEEIGKLWSKIQEAEKVLLKWQNIDCAPGEPYQRETQVKEEDMSEYLIRFIKDALFHFLMDQVSARTKQEQLDLLISFFKFSENEMESIKKNNGNTIRTQSVSW